MKVLVIPMAAMAETGGPSSRCKSLAEGFKKAGIDVAACMAEDINFRKMDGIRNFYLDVPMPLGLPKCIATRSFPIAEKLGITARKTVNSFDQVLTFTGNLNYGYLKKSVESVRRAVQDFKPDIIYSEFNISAIIAAKADGIPLYTTVSYPTQHEYAHNSKLAEGLNKLLNELSLPEVESALQLFDWADRRFCPSIYELEPIEKLKGISEGICYCGTFKAAEEFRTSEQAETDRKTDTGKEHRSRNRILVYMGNGTISASKTLKVMKEAFRDSEYDIYIASKKLREESDGNIHVAPRWDFSKLLPESVLFINHGGQNSIADGLLYGVPELIVPGKVFERKYNAKSVEDNGAGTVLPYTDFDATNIMALTEKTVRDRSFERNARSLGQKLLDAGGVGKIIDTFYRL